jgi:hypothetical protein
MKEFVLLIESKPVANPDFESVLLLLLFIQEVCLSLRSPSSNLTLPGEEDMLCEDKIQFLCHKTISFNNNWLQYW